MPNARTYQWLADAVLLLHFAVVVFIVGGLVAVLAGNALRWRWVNGIAFRVLHVAAIGVVVLQAWLGQLCPLTILESWLREQAGQSACAASFVEHWVQRVLYYQAPWWVFTLIYTAFGGLVAWAWWRHPPSRAATRR